MPVRFRCVCGKKLKTPDGSVGKRAKCPTCAAWVRVPVGSDTYDCVAVEARTDEAEHDPPADAKEGSALNLPMVHGEAVGTVPAPPPKTSSGRIVLADSSAADLDQTAEMLREHSYTVISATDGQHVLELIRKEKPDVIMINVKLDNMSGFQVIQQIRNVSNPLNRDIWTTPIIMTTEKLHGRDKQYAMSLGVDDYFVKPITPAQICAKLEKAVAKFRAPHGG